MDISKLLTISSELLGSGLDEITVYWSKKLACLFGRASRQVDPGARGGGRNENDLFAIRHFHHQEVSKMLTQFVQRLIAGSIDAPVLAPALLYQRFEQRRLLR